MQAALTHTGRTLLGLYFLLPGIMKFAAWDMHVELMQTHEMPMIPVLLVLAGVLQIAGSLCLLCLRASKCSFGGVFRLPWPPLPASEL